MKQTRADLSGTKSDEVLKPVAKKTAESGKTAETEKPSETTPETPPSPVISRDSLLNTLVSNYNICHR